MIVRTVVEIIDEYENTVILHQNGKPIKIWEVNFEINSKEIEGKGNAYYFIHSLNDAEEVATTQLIRGYAHFEGRIAGQYGKFLSQDDGHKHAGMVEVNGRIIDASEDLILLVGRYNFSGVHEAKELDLTMDIEL